MTRLILASGSQIRRQIMDNAGLKFEVISKPVDEASIKNSLKAQGVSPRDIADALAEAKSVKVSRSESGLVIGADQIMVMDGEMFDKPTSLAAARERLNFMRGKKHSLIGAIVVSENGMPVWRHLAQTHLYVREFSDAFLETYLEAEKAYVCHSVGAYRFEGRGAHLFSKVEGDFFSILGLSLLPLLDYLRIRGIVES